MREKIIMGLALAAGMITALIYGGWLLFAVAMTGSAFAMWEYYGMISKKRNVHPMTLLGIFFGLMFITFAFLGRWAPSLSSGSANIGAVITVYVFCILVIQFSQIIQHKEKYSILDLGITVFGSIYIGAFMSFAFLLLNLGETQFKDSLFRARMVLFLPMWASWGTDVGAYFFGKFFGKNRIFPDISPKKTLEGCMGGAFCSMVGFGVMAPIVAIPVSHGLALGLFASLMGQVGDLSESALKREVGVKDSGALLGSHGGFLDRMDSFLFTTPVIYHYFLWVNPWK